MLSQCPACNTDLPENAPSCPECGLALIMEPLELQIERQGSFVTLALFNDLIKAQILEGRLKAEGIPALITGDEEAYWGISSPASISPTRVVVPADRAAEAVRALAADGQWTEDQLNRYLSQLDEAPPES